jgi:hypothetical protein
VRLADFDKSRVRYHLGYYVVSVPAGDYSRLEESLNTVPDSYFYDKIIIQVGRCDTAEKKTEVATSPSTRIENIAGDVDRTIRSSNAKEALKVWTRFIFMRQIALLIFFTFPTIKIPSRPGIAMNALVLNSSKRCPALLT